MKEIRIGILGWGVVGDGVIKLLQERGEEITRRTGVRVVIKKVCDIDLERPREVKLPSSLLTTQAEEVIEDENIDVVVELIGGIHPAREYIISSLEKGKDVVTANKALLAAEGKEILEKARERGRRVYFEASVMSGVPLLRSLREGMVACKVEEVLGIINGTTNFILTRMEEGKSFQEALRTAQEKGFAESDPSLDVEGWDTAHKLSILSYLCFGTWPPSEDAFLVEGISRIGKEDIEYAKELGYRVKLLAVGKLREERLELRVSPTLLPEDHPLAGVREEFNAVYLKTDTLGEVTFQGKGAGSLPTANGVISDIVEAAGEDSPLLPPSHPLPLIKREEVVLPYYLRFRLEDKPGVLAKIAGILGKRGISISSVVQKGREKKGGVPVIMTTHQAREGDIKKALEEIDSLPVVKDRTCLIRMEKEY